MKSLLGGRWRNGAVVLVLALITACGGTQSTSDSTDPGDGSPQSTSSETAPPPESEAPEPETPEPETPEPETGVTVASGEDQLGAPSGECGTTTTMIDTNTPHDIGMFGSTAYVCVMVPDGVARVVVEISEMTAALNLFVGYPDLSTLQAGGDGFWASERGGRDDESIVIEPLAGGFVEPGSYFIEISGGASADGSSFVLTVTVP